MWYPSLTELVNKGGCMFDWLDESVFERVWMGVGILFAGCIALICAIATLWLVVFLIKTMFV